MSDSLLAVLTFFHVLATVVLVGHYLLAGFVYLPGLKRRLSGTALAVAVDEIDLAARPWLIGAIVVFGATGTLLMVTNRAYTGWTGLSLSPWATLVLAKHLLVAALVVAAIVLEIAAAPAAVDMAATEVDRQRSLDRLILAMRGIAALGIVILAFTAAAQVA